MVSELCCIGDELNLTGACSWAPGARLNSSISAADGACGASCFLDNISSPDMSNSSVSLISDEGVNSPRYAFNIIYFSNFLYRSLAC